MFIHVFLDFKSTSTGRSVLTIVNPLWTPQDKGPWRVEAWRQRHFACQNGVLPNAW